MSSHSARTRPTLNGHSPSRSKSSSYNSLLPLPAGLFSSHRTHRIALQIERIRQHVSKRSYLLVTIVIVCILLFGTIFIPFMAVEQLHDLTTFSYNHQRNAGENSNNVINPLVNSVTNLQMENGQPRTIERPGRKGKLIGELQQQQQQQQAEQQKVPPLVLDNSHGLPAIVPDSSQKREKDALSIDIPVAEIKPPAPAALPPTSSTNDNEKPSAAGAAADAAEADIAMTESKAAAIPAAAEAAVAPDVSTVQGKQQAIKQAFLHAWRPYVEKCYGSDEVQPISLRCNNWLNQAATLIDSMGTLWIMELYDDFMKAVGYIQTSFKPEEGNRNISFFETVIRCLGGLLSAYDMTEQAAKRGNQSPYGFQTTSASSQEVSSALVSAQTQEILLAKAQLLGDRLMPAFQTNTGLPRSQINLAAGISGDYTWTAGHSLLAEIGTVQMEYSYLAHKVKNYEKYGRPSYERIYNHMYTKMNDLHPKGLFPYYINPNTGSTGNNVITFGAMGDSYFEYLLKVWLLTGKRDSKLKEMYLLVVDSMIRHLVTVSKNGKTMWLADLENGHKKNKMDHLACFVPGMLALGVAHGVTDNLIWSEETNGITKEMPLADKHMDIAERLTETCYNYYHLNKETGLSAEYYNFEENSGDMFVGEPSYKLRPEVLESIFIMWRLTHEAKYREWGWETFQSIEKNARVAHGYSGLANVKLPNSHDDREESFFFAETLKYLYLLFSDDHIVELVGDGKPGSYQVFNTECHPLTSFVDDSFPHDVTTQPLQASDKSVEEKFAALKAKSSASNQGIVADASHDSSINVAAADTTEKISEKVQASAQQVSNRAVAALNHVRQSAPGGAAVYDPNVPNIVPIDNGNSDGNLQRQPKSVIDSSNMQIDASQAIKRNRRTRGKP